MVADLAAANCRALLAQLGGASGEVRLVEQPPPDTHMGKVGIEYARTSVDLLQGGLGGQML